MSYVVDNVPGECFIVKREHRGIFESWRVVKSLGLYKILHRTNDTANGCWVQRYSKEWYNTADEAIASLKEGLGIG